MLVPGDFTMLLHFYKNGSKEVKIFKQLCTAEHNFLHVHTSSRHELLVAIILYAFVEKSAINSAECAFQVLFIWIF